MAAAPIRVGILGAAGIAPWGMLQPANRRDDVVVSAIAARDPARARAMADQHGVAHVAARYGDLIARDDVDLVYVALPVSGHAEWSIRALEAGKAVLCEKPFAMNATEAAEMVAAADHAGRPLIEAIHYRFHAVTDRALEIMRSGVLGRVVEASGEFVYPVPFKLSEIRWRAALGGGAAMDDGCYPIHALRTLLQREPTVTSARSRYAHGVDAETWAELRFGETSARIHVSLETEAPKALIEIIGEAGRLRIDNFITPQWKGALTLERGGVVETPRIDGLPTWDAQLAHVVDVLRGNCAPLTGGRDAIANMAVIDAVKRGARWRADQHNEGSRRNE